MKFKIKCVQNMCGPLFIFFAGIFGFSCSSAELEQKKVFTEYYPLLYEAVYDRNGDQLLEFTTHHDSLVRAHAWRSIIQTDIDDLDLLIEQVIEVNLDDAWSSLWFKDFTDEHIEYFNSLWDNNTHLRGGLLSLFGEVGDRSTFELLIAENEIDDPDFDYKLAYATGARSRNITLTTDEEIRLIDKALSTKDGKKTQAYLYGYYRKRKSFSVEAERHVLAKWKEYYPNSEEGEQSLVRILGNTNLDQVLQHFPIESYERMNIQLAIEIAQMIASNTPTNYSKVVCNALLDHINPNVQIEALKAIQAFPEVADRLFRDIMNKIALTDGADPLARMQAFNTINNPGDYESEILTIAGKHSHLQILKYEILEKFYSNASFFELLKKDINQDERHLKSFAVRYLPNWWFNTNESFKKENRSQVKELVLNILELGDRTMSLSLASFFSDSVMFSKEDYLIVFELLSTFSLPKDVEVFQVYSKILYTHFKENARDFIDSLAVKGNRSLNRSLIEHGWSISEINTIPVNIREPNWDRMLQKSEHPFIIIETSKGDIIVELYINLAPVTIASMDSLMEVGAYQKIPFHRVIPNFVIQGGDIELQDGFGGPNYIVPTEASNTMYSRGIVGIASAGIDTEGSQFFITNQWKPHLNGRYTVVGKVRKGLDVIDNIVQGDLIERMFWH